MSNLDRTPPVRQLGGLTAVAPRPAHELFAGKTVRLGEASDVVRMLPNLGRRLVGPWCFVDHYGPDDIADRPGMVVPPHPHIGLQTVSWLLAGEVHHRDSLGSDAVIRPGALGLMTAGAGIAHAEHSPVPHPALLHGVQLWVALPDAARATAAAWQHETALPSFTEDGLELTLILGELAGARSPGATHSPLVAAQVTATAGARAALTLEPGFEHAVLVLSGSAVVDGELLAPGSMLYLGTGRASLELAAQRPARLLLLGGAPFEEQIVMWWNFVARSHEEIAAARANWSAGHRFGEVAGAGAPLPAPPLAAGRLKPGGATR